jgi:methionine-R-sulfoxide reductase
MQTWPDIEQILTKGNPDPVRRVTKTDDEWRQQLGDELFQIARRGATERPFSSEMCRLFEPGEYHCVCCSTPLFDSGGKFDSGTGWPSFTQAITPAAIAYHGDSSHGMSRVEVTCNTCGAHLGHVFPDGPPPSGLRYCINATSIQRSES